MFTPISSTPTTRSGAGTKRNSIAPLKTVSKTTTKNCATVASIGGTAAPATAAPPSSTIDQGRLDAAHPLATVGASGRRTAAGVPGLRPGRRVVHSQDVLMAADDRANSHD